MSVLGCSPVPRSPTPYPERMEGGAPSRRAERTGGKRDAPRKNWCMTVFPDKEENPGKVFDDKVMNYLVVGNEKCPETGRDHWQCYVQFRKKVRFGAVKAIFGDSIHIEVSRGSDEDNFRYCTKDGDYYQYGTRVNTAGGQRSDLSAACEAATTMTLDQLMENEEHQQVVARHMQYFRQLYANRASQAGKDAFKRALAGSDLRPWQSALLDIVKESPCDRKIYWCHDACGGTGKSFMAKYLVAFHDAIIYTNGKLADMACAYKHEPVVIVDLARCAKDNMDHWYQFMESLKNGVLFSSKYESTTKLFKSPHVIVFANFCPDEQERLSKLSADRWCIFNLDTM